MKKFRTYSIRHWAFPAILFIAGCGESSSGTNFDASDRDTDTVTDVNTEIDTGTDRNSDIQTDTASDSETDTLTACDIELLSASLSETIGTVGIVTWKNDMTDISEAHIDFGLDTSYGLTAPVDLNEVDYRTVLLGMKENRGPYHFRITAISRTKTCVSEDFAFESKTAARPEDLELPEVVTHYPNEIFGGFLITVEYRDELIDSADYAFIVDGDGDPVWWYRPEGYGDLTTARMSYDGKYMWLAHGNVPNMEGRLGRVRMDGTGWEDLREEFPWLHHDMTILPDETVVYLSYYYNECDDVIEVAPDGTSRVVINSAEALGNPVVCHGNAIQYSPFDDTYVVSDTNFNAYFKVDRQGNVIWVLGGGPINQFDLEGGGASDWTANHNFHLLDVNRMVFFNNGSQNDTIPAVVREIVLDLDAMTTEEVWQYAANPPVMSGILGDVQRLPGGNTVVAYSASGIVHEVNAQGKLLQEMHFPQGMIGYFTKRATLYGPPPR